MKKIIPIAILAGSLLSTVFATDSGAEPYQAVRLDVSVDYAKTSMNQVNKELNKGTDVTEVGSAISGMVTFGIALTPNLMLGARSGYLFCMPGSASNNLIVYNRKTTLDASLVPLEAGLSASTQVSSTPVSITAGLYAGYGFAFASFKNEIDVLGQTGNFTVPYKGGNFIGELPVSVNFKVSSSLSVNLNGGYRMALISQMRQSEDVNFEGISGVSIPVGDKGDVLKNSDDKDLAFDYSGFNVGVGFNLGF